MSLQARRRVPARAESPAGSPSPDIDEKKVR
jgi:hypothetical protein